MLWILCVANLRIYLCACVFEREELESYSDGWMRMPMPGLDVEVRGQRSALETGLFFSQGFRESHLGLQACAAAQPASIYPLSRLGGLAFVFYMLSIAHNSYVMTFCAFSFLSGPSLQHAAWRPRLGLKAA